MNEEGVSLRPVSEADLDQVRLFATDPSALGEFEWFGFADPEARRRRWEKDGLISEESTWLTVALGDGSFAGIVTWAPAKTTPWTSAMVGCFEVGIALLPQHRGRGIGTTAQRLLVRYLFDNTPVHRLQAGTEADNVAEQHALERVGFTREGVKRQLVFRAGSWRDMVIYGLLREEAGSPPGDG
jgi:[ribosomal protein S5]-alanine N-acetyltransferase